MKIKRQDPNKAFLFGMLIIALFSCRIWASTKILQNRYDERILRQMANQEELSGRFKEAAEHYIKLLEIKPNELSLYLSAKRCLLQTKEYDKWYNLILSIQRSYRDVQFEVDMAEIAYLRGNKELALQQWRSIVDENAVSERAYLLVGNVLTEYRLLDEAADIYIMGRKKFKDPYHFFYELIRIYTLQSDFESMTKEYLSLLKRTPSQVNFVQGQLLSAAQTTEAYEKITRVVELEFKQEKALAEFSHRILGALFTQGKNYKKALQHYLALEETIDINKNEEKGQYLYSFAMAAISDGAYTEARQSIERLLTLKDIREIFKVRTELALAQIYEREQKSEEAIQAYEEIIEKYPKSNEILAALYRIAAIYLDRLFDIPNAEKSYLRILKTKMVSSNDVLKCKQKLAECAIARDDLEKAKEYLFQICNESQSSSERYRQAALLLSYIDTYYGHPTIALKRLEELIKIYHSDKFSTADNTENDILELYLLLRDNQNDSVGVAMLGKVILLQSQRKYKSAIDSIENFLSKGSYSGVRDRLLLNKIELLRKAKRSQEALLVCQEWLGDSTMVYRELAMKTEAEIYDQDIGDNKNSVEMYTQFLEKYPQSIYIEQIRKRIREIDKNKSAFNK